jgi:hypothetical protein
MTNVLLRIVLGVVPLASTVHINTSRASYSVKHKRSRMCFHITIDGTEGSLSHPRSCPRTLVLTSRVLCLSARRRKVGSSLPRRPLCIMRVAFLPRALTPCSRAAGQMICAQKAHNFLSRPQPDYLSSSDHFPLSSHRRMRWLFVVFAPPEQEPAFPE